MTDYRLISMKQLFEFNATACYGDKFDCVDLSERQFNSLPKLEDVREVCEALESTSYDAYYVGCMFCKEHTVYRKDLDRVVVEHLVSCPVTKAKAILSKIGG